MKAKFAALFPDTEVAQATLAQITWYHNIALMDKVKDTERYIWYANKTAENGWSQNVLVHQIESGLYERQVLTEYELKDMSKPMGISEYRLTSALPKELERQFPTTDDIRNRISNDA